MSQLNVIYHFQASQNQDSGFRPASYRVVYFFSDDGFIDKNVLKQLLKSFPTANQEEMTFLNLDELKDFSLRVAQELQAPLVKLLSVQDYNIGIDGAKDLKNFKDIFVRYGESVVNENAVKKKGILGKFFS